MATLPLMILLAVSGYGGLLILAERILQHSEFDSAVRSLRSEFEAKLQQCTDKIDTLAAEIRERQLKQEERLEDKLEITCKQNKKKQRSKRQSVIFSSTPTVAFFAQLTSDLFQVHDNQTIVFDLTETNIGHGYDETSGVFTAPGSGVFVFVWGTTNYNQFSYLQSELMVNGIIKGRQWSDSGIDNDVSSATGSAVLSLSKGDTVWIRTNTAHLGDTLKGGLMSSFSGWLLK